MLTAEDISNVEFTKTLGGYKTAEVDDFLDECADTVAALTNERLALNKKLEVLADKVVEYREKVEEYQREEDSIKTALVTAQRMGDSVLREANQKAELILQDAEIKAQNIHETAQQQIVEENQELARLRQAVSDFKDQLYKQYKAHLELIGLLPQTEPEQQTAEVQHSDPEPAVTEQAPEQPVSEPQDVAEIAEEPAEDSVKIFGQMPPQVQSDVQVIPPADSTQVLSASSETQQESSAPKNRFTDIRFGEEYDMTDEPEEERKGFFKRKK